MTVPKRRKNMSSSSHQVSKKDDSSSTTSPPPPLREVVVNRSEDEHDEPDVDAVKPPNKQRKRSLCRFILFPVGLLVSGVSAVFLLKRFGLQDALLEKVHTVFPQINKSIDSLTLNMITEKLKVGHVLAQEGAKANYPLVMVPGFVTSGLEVWGGKDCAKGFFRQRLWAALTGARSFLVERDCWREHMMLDPLTGGDPDGIRVRASEGFAATDYFMGNFWVWGKLIENLAEVGYTPSNMVMHPFDWRLPYHLLEERDGCFTHLKYRIEALHKTTGKKIVLAAHSMGAMVVHHFFGWVETDEKQGGGGGGKKWVDKYIHTYINIAGSHLGVPKAATALLSGEMSDTVLDGRMATLIESFFGRKLRRELWSSWGALWTMLPKGGDALWGPGSDFCEQRSANDTLCPSSESSFSPLIAMTDVAEGNTAANVEANASACAVERNESTLFENFMSRQQHMTDDLLDFLVEYGSGLGPDTVGSKFHSQHGTDKDKSRSWYDVTRSPLPDAPSMRIFCLYGTGLPTERAFYYKRNWEEQADPKSQRILSEPAAVIDPINDDETHVKYGIRYTDGDGSVPLLSLGYICADAWTRSDSGLNPSNAKVYTREYLHKAEFCVDDPMRSGPQSADHVDVLGNNAMMNDFLRIVTGFENEEVEEDLIVSNIREIAKKINSHPHGGVFLKKKKSWLTG